MLCLFFSLKSKTVNITVIICILDCLFSPFFHHVDQSRKAKVHMKKTEVLVC